MFAIRTITGSSAAVTQTLCGRSARAMRRATIACSSRSLAERSSCSPRWSSTAGSALRRVEPASASVAARMPSRRTSSSGLAATNARVAAPDAEHVAARERLAQHAEHRGGVVRRAARGPAPRARARSSRASPARIRSTAARDGAPRSARAASRWRRGSAPTGSGSSSGSGAARSSPSARLEPREQVLGGVVGRGQRGERQRAPRRRARASATSGTCSDAGAKPAQCGARAAVGREREAADGHQPGAARAVGRRRTSASRGQRAPARARRASKRSGAGAPRARAAQPERRERGAVAVGLLEAEPRLAGAPRRERRPRSGRRRARPSR